MARKTDDRSDAPLDTTQARRGDPQLTRERRDAILKTALRLYAREGYGAVTMRAIAQELGFSAPAIYHYFLSKEEIFVVLQEAGLQRTVEFIMQPETDDPLHDLRMIYLRYYEFSKAYPDDFTLIYIDPSVPTIKEKFEALKKMREYSFKIIRRCIDSGLFPVDIESQDVAPVLWNVIHGPAVLRLVRSLEHAADLDYDRLAATVLDLAIAGIRAGLLPHYRASSGGE